MEATSTTFDSGINFFVFDLDGTLIDSAKDIINALHKTQAHFEKPLTSTKTIREYVGTGIMPLLLKDIPRSVHTQYQNYFYEQYEQCATDLTRPYEGVLNLLEGLDPERCVVLTNKIQKFAKQICDNLNISKHFATIYGRDSFEKPKPDPMSLLAIMKIHQAVPAQTVMIGDTKTDISAGLNAKCYTCFMSHGYGHYKDLGTNTPSYTAKNFSELKHLLTHQG